MIIPYLGGFINAYTEHDVTCYYIMIPSEELDKALHILADISYKANFDNQDVLIEKNIIIQEINQYANEPESAFIDWIQSTYFSGNNLKNLVLGTKESVRNATSKSLRRFYKHHYTPENAYMVISGNFELNKLKDSISSHFSNWNSKVNIPKCNPNDLNPEQHGFRLFIKNTQSKICNNLAFVLPELNESHSLNDALLLIVKAFASGKQSRLYKRLVEKDKLAEEVRLHSISGLLPGITIIHILPKSEDYVLDIIYAFYDEWIKIKQAFYLFDEIKLMKQELIHGWYYDFEYIESIASGLANEDLIKSYKEYYNFPEKIAQVSSKQFQKCLDEYWSADYLAIYYKGKMRLPNSINKNITKLFSSNENQANRITEEGWSLPISKDVIGSATSDKNSCKHKQDFMSITLDNGSHVIFKRVLNKPTIGIAITSAISQLSEQSSQRGHNFFTSNLLLYGTEKSSYDEIQKSCLMNGFNIKINHTLETTTLKGKCLADNIDKLMPLVVEILTKPRFPQNYLKIMKSNVIDSLRREKEVPFSLGYNRWSAMLFGRNSNLIRPYPLIKELSFISVPELKAWHQNYYNMSNFTICITGDFDFDKMSDMCNRNFVDTYTKPTTPRHIAIKQSAINKYKLVKVDSDQSNIIMGGFGCPSSDTISNSAFYVLSQILGGELSSRFFNILREKHGYTYQTGFDFTSIEDLGYWFAYAICDKSKYSKVYKLMLEILNDVRINGVSDSELLSAKKYLIGMQRFDMESLSWQATTLSILYALGYDYDYFMGRENRLNAIDKDTIKHIAEKWLAPNDIYAYVER
jgi:zinc protease